MVAFYFVSEKFLTLGSIEGASKHVQMNLQKWTEEEAAREGGRRASQTYVPGPI